MQPYFVKTPSFIPLIYPNQTWRFTTKEKQLYLTFDDGPTPEVTDWVLDLLAQYNAKATFFCIGKNIEKYPSIFKRIVASKHAIGNHTYDHLNGWKTSTKDYFTSILKTQKIIQSTSNSKLFRPPYGKIKRSQTKALIKEDYHVIMWSVLSADFDKKIDANKCLENVIDNATNGSIIVFHDSNKAFDKLQEVLPKILEHFNKKGYSFKKIEGVSQAKRTVEQD